ncbi:MAG: hypothetical protein ACI8V0_001342 [Pseudohongiellaceae bacterium]
MAVGRLYQPNLGAALYAQYCNISSTQPYKNGFFTDVESGVAAKQKPKLKSMDEVDHKLILTFEKLGVTLQSTLFSAA